MRDGPYTLSFTLRYRERKREYLNVYLLFLLVSFFLVLKSFFGLLEKSFGEARRSEFFFCFHGHFRLLPPRPSFLLWPRNVEQRRLRERKWAIPFFLSSFSSLNWMRLKSNSAIKRKRKYDGPLVLPSFILGPPETLIPFLPSNLQSRRAKTNIESSYTRRKISNSPRSNAYQSSFIF